jgi:hypothetical protein
MNAEEICLIATKTRPEGEPGTDSTEDELESAVPGRVGPAPGAVRPQRVPGRVLTGP